MAPSIPKPTEIYRSSELRQKFHHGARGEISGKSKAEVYGFTPGNPQVPLSDRIMAVGTLELTLRPLKLAFLVDPADGTALTEAIQINSFLWGGMFNPIIPVFRRLPSVWRERFHEHLMAQTLITGYLDVYDPDYVVTVGKVAPPKAGVGFREVISSSEILAEIQEGGTPKYGVGLNEVLNRFEDQELKFVRHHPLSICLPEWRCAMLRSNLISICRLKNGVAGIESVNERQNPSCQKRPHPL